MLFFLSLLSIINGYGSRERYTMNFNWLFHLGSIDLPHTTCKASEFKKTNNKYCQGFTKQPNIALNEPDLCADACCANPTCNYFIISNTGNCWLGDTIAIYNAFSWTETCSESAYNTFYSRSNIPDINPGHFGAASKDFDDTDWWSINLPHDFIVNNTPVAHPNTDEPRTGSHGYLPKNTSWYRKHFKLDESYNNDNTIMWIDFDGIYRNSIVFLNGIFLGNHSSGYTSFMYYLDSDKYNLEYGDNSNNVLSIFVDATADEGWWYEGGGIYRNVWFNKAYKVFFNPYGGIYLPTFVNKINNDGITGNGSLLINATILNYFDHEYTVDIYYNIIYDNKEFQLLKVSSKRVPANSHANIITNLTNVTVNLWSPENPALYTINCSIFDTTDGNEIDFVSLKYGYRQAIFDVNEGLILNNKKVKIKGFCNHQDFGGTGIATPEQINRFRIHHLKDMGANAWRMSHNPPNPELLDFADEYGFLIWDENRHFGNSTQWIQDQQDMIVRDRNHPSIIIWSVCNEAGCQKDSPNIDLVADIFKDTIRSYDDTYNNNKWGYGRPIAGAGWLTTYLDFASANYNDNLDPYHKQHPNQSIIESESCSCTTDRNEYVGSDGYCSPYGNCPWDSSITCPDGCWKTIATDDYIIGSFDWTGFDYKGEPYPDTWPDINSHFGINDIIGYPKDNYYYYRSAFIDFNDEIILHIMPNTWNNDTGTNPIQVRVFTNCPYIELFINGISLSKGVKQKVALLDYYTTNVTYVAGNISCNCYDHKSNYMTSTTLETRNDAESIILSWAYPKVTTNTILGDGQDVCMINVHVVDNKNRIVTTSNNLIEFSLNNEDIAFILGVGNGNPTSHETDKGTSRSVFHGKARILIQSKLNKSGKVILTAKSRGLQSDEITINIQQPSSPIVFV